MTDVLQRLVQTSARIANINFGKENKRPNAVKIRQLETNEESLLFSKKKGKSPPIFQKPVKIDEIPRVGNNSNNQKKRCHNQ